MKLVIDRDEWYPMFSLRKPTPGSKYDEGSSYEVGEDLWERWKRVEAELDDLQEVLRGIRGDTS